MAEISREEFMRSIGMEPDPLPAPQATNAPLALIPETQAALDEQTRKLGAGRIESVAQSRLADPDIATRLGARPGVPFDVNSGVSFMSRLRSAAQPTPEEEEKALTAAYGAGNVRRNSFGWLVVTKPGADGKPTDVLADPIGIEFGDAAEILGQLPEIAGGLLAAIKTRGASMAPGIWNAAKTLLATVAGSAAGGVAKDVAVRATEGEPIQPGEIATRRGQLAAIDATVGVGTGLGAKAVGTFISPFSAGGPIQFEAKKAQEYFRGKYGVQLSMTPAETTGNTFLAKTEAQQAAKPGSSVPYEKLLAERDRQLNELQRLALGGAVPDEEAAGQRALAALGAKTAPLEQNVQRGAAATATEVETELVRGIGSPVDKTAVGASIRTRAMELRAEFKAKTDALYNDVFSDPLTKTKNISGNELAKEASELTKKLPSVQDRIEKISYDAYGSPISVVSVKPATLREFVPENVIPKLEALKRGKGQQFRLDELMQMRREIDNDIAQGEAVPGVQTRYLSDIRSWLTDRIKTGLDELSPDLRKKWETANDEYAKGVVKFKKAGISEIFRDPEQGGFLGDTALVDRVTSGGTKAQDTYRSYKEFFGAGSPEVQSLQQSVRDDIFGRDRIEGFVDAKGFISRLTALAKDAPTVFDDSFGASAASLRNSARALSVAQGETLPEEELIKAVNSGNMSGKMLSEMLSAQATKDAAYRNELVKAVSEGNIKPDRIKPTELVNRMVFKKDTQPSDLQGVIGLLQDRPDVLEDIRRLTFRKALDQATSVNPATGRGSVAASDLAELLTDQNSAKRLQTALGASTFNDLTQLTAFLRPGALSQQAAKSAASLSAGAQIAAITEKGAWQAVDRAVRNFFIATAYTSPPIRALITNAALSREGKANLVNYVIASTPFIEAVSRSFTEEQARKVMVSLKGAVDGMVRDNPEEAGVQARPSREEFIRAISEGVPANPAPAAP